MDANDSAWRTHDLAFIFVIRFDSVDLTCGFLYVLKIVVVRRGF